MKPRTLIALVLMVVLPLVLLGWLGLRSAREQRELAESRLDQLLEARLNDLDRRMQAVLDETAGELLRLTSELAEADSEELRRRVFGEPRVDQLFVQRGDGRLLHPPLGQPLSRSEQQFLQRTRQVFAERLLLELRGADELAAQQQATINSSFRHLDVVGQELAQGQSIVQGEDLEWGWYAWYWDSGLHLIFWQRHADGRVVGAEVNRMRLLADIIEALDGDSAAENAPAGTVELVDSRGRTLHRLGPLPDTTGARAKLSLDPPLAAWKLRYHYPESPAAMAGSLWWRALGLLVGGLTLVGFAVYIYRESTREIREASRRVTFVDQVSHELRTPLTNIRMYAELLEARLANEDGKTRGQLAVIIAESHRLSRLIGNVLSFGRHQRGQLKLRLRRGDIDATVACAVERFRPALEQNGIRVESDLNAAVELEYDADAVEQILGNLLNNVEKYAASGGKVSLSSRVRDGHVEIAVHDDGPGIPATEAERVFEPFARLDNRLTEGVSGAGIGLALSRDLARLHGGDLRLAAAEHGARLELILPLSDYAEVS